MSCKHEMTHLPFTGQKHCCKCGKTAQEIDLESKLEAANERIVVLEKDNDAKNAIIYAAKKNSSTNLRATVDVLRERLAAAETALAEERAAREQAKAALHPAQHGAQFDESCFNPDVKVNP